MVFAWEVSMRVTLLVGVEEIQRKVEVLKSKHFSEIPKRGQI